jgi:hypothetical protein
MNTPRKFINNKIVSWSLIAWSLIASLILKKQAQEELQHHEKPIKKIELHIKEKLRHHLKSKKIWENDSIHTSQ